MGGNTFDELVDVGLNIITFGGHGAKQAQEAAEATAKKERKRTKKALLSARAEAEQAEDAASAAAEKDRRKRIKAGQESGRASTISTGPLGLTTPVASAKKKLLGE